MANDNVLSSHSLRNGFFPAHNLSSSRLESKYDEDSISQTPTGMGHSDFESIGSITRPKMVGESELNQDCLEQQDISFDHRGDSTKHSDHRLSKGVEAMLPDFNREVHCLLGLPFDAIDMSGSVQKIRAAAANRSRCFLSTPNLNFLIAAQSDDAFRNSVINSDLSIADGMPLVWIAAMLGIPISSRVAGSALFDSLRVGAGKPVSVYFFGGPDGAAKAACRKLNQEGRGLTCVGFESPGFGSIEEMSMEDTIQRINSSNADFLVVSLGAKKGQAWIERNRARISVPLISHLGAVVNFVAGTVKRAPVWMQNVGLEWLWRIKEDPALWRRYYKDGLAFLTLLVTRVIPYAWFLLRHKAEINQQVIAIVETSEDKTTINILLQGAWTLRNLEPLRDCFRKAAMAEKDVRLELSGVTYVDSAFVGLVMLLYGHQTKGSRFFQIELPSERVRRIIRYCGAEFLC